MAKVVESVEVSLQMWANVSLSADEIQDIYPEFADMTAGDDTEEMEQAIEEYMNMNYMDHVQYSIRRVMRLLWQRVVQLLRPKYESRLTILQSSIVIYRRMGTSF